MTTETLALIAAYLMCSEAAEVRVLNASEIESCTSIYMQVKLSFVPDIQVYDYQRAAATERATLNQQGYAGYLAWRVSNPDLVQDMEANARMFVTGQADQSESR
ncbi:MAG: hypothetical protein AAFU41_05365 [Pseudomonadota bacterium]